MTICVLGVNKGRYSINSKIKNKVNWSSRLILNSIFQKINLTIVKYLDQGETLFMTHRHADEELVILLLNKNQ